MCVNMERKIMWETKRAPDFTKVSMILADRLILASDGAKTLFWIEPDSAEFKSLASAPILAEGGTGSENAPLASRVGGSTRTRRRWRFPMAGS